MDLKKILIVDDDADDSELFIEAMSSLGMKTNCFCANDGQQAIELLENEGDKPDIIFLDINMPVMNGWQCLSKLKSEAALKDIPVIIYTTSSQAKDRNLARDLGAICFVTKIHDFKKIKQMLEIVTRQMQDGYIDKICDSIYKNLSLN